MGLVKNKEDLPGWKMAKSLYDMLPGSGKVKKIVVGVLALAGAVAVGGLVIIGIFSAIAWVAGSVFGATLLATGVIAALPLVIKLIGVAAPAILNFDWNISDEQIDEQLNQAIQAFYSQVGEAAGVSVGWLVCGILPGAATFAINPSAAAMITASLTEEAGEEIWASINNCKQASTMAAANALIKQGYKNARRWVKKPGSPMHDFLVKQVGQERLDKWGEKDGKSWSIAKEIEERIEQVEDPWAKQATEEFVENFFESCGEAWRSMESAMRQHLTANALWGRTQSNAANQQIVMQLDFSRDDDDSSTSQPQQT